MARDDPVTGDLLGFHAEIGTSMDLEPVHLHRATLVQENINPLPGTQLAALKLFSNAIFTAPGQRFPGFLIQGLEQRNVIQSDSFHRPDYDRFCRATNIRQAARNGLPVFSAGAPNTPRISIVWAMRLNMGIILDLLVSAIPNRWHDIMKDLIGKSR